MVNLHTHADIVRGWLKNNRNGIRVRLAEEPTLLGSAGTVLASRYRLIRPLALVTEDLSTEYARVQGFLPISCVCGEKESVRREIREFLDAMKSRHLGISESITASLGNVNPYTLFSAPEPAGAAEEE